jgi:heterodisulfide reductase subunit A
VDTLSNQKIEIGADLVVLATAMVASGQNGLAGKLRIVADEHGFFKEAHPKLRPVETLTSGVFLAGAAQAPKDILETVAQASGAASKALELFSQGEIEREPTVAVVNEATCTACFDCQRVCPFGAVGAKEILDKSGRLVKRVAHVNEAVCSGCGACAVACRNHSMDVLGFSDEEVFSEIMALA